MLIEAKLYRRKATQRLLSEVLKHRKHTVPLTAYANAIFRYTSIAKGSKCALIYEYKRESRKRTLT